MPPAQLRELQSPRLRRGGAAGLRARRTCIASRMDERGREAGRHPRHRRHRPAAADGEDRSARHVSLRAVRQPDARRGAAARLQRHDRQADRRGLHPGRPGRVDRGDASARLAGYGLHEGDVVQNAYGYGLFTGGLGIHYGAEALGATVIPISGGNTDRQIMVMQDFGVSAICCTPSYFLHMLDRADETGRRHARAAAAGRRASAPSRGPTACAATSKRPRASRPSTSTA